MVGVRCNCGLLDGFAVGARLLTYP